MNHCCGRDHSNTTQDRVDVGAISRSESVIPSPSTYGFVPPQPSPATWAAAPEQAASPLEPIHEDGSDILRAIADASDLTLHDSKYASKDYRGKTKYSTMPTRHAPVLSFDTLEEDPTADSPSKKSEHEKLISKYQDEVVAKFLENRLPEGKLEQIFNQNTC